MFRKILLFGDAALSIWKTILSVSAVCSDLLRSGLFFVKLWLLAVSSGWAEIEFSTNKINHSN